MKLIAGTRSLFTVLISMALVFGLQACSGGGGSSTPATPAVNTSLASAARGYYDGSASIDGGTNNNVTTATTGTKVQAIFDEKGFVIAYKGLDDSNAAIVLMYKGTFTEVSATAFKANVRVYVNGVYQMTSSISNGAIDPGVTLTGAIVGTGDYANSTGDISFSYTTDNAKTPPVYAFGTANRWRDAGPTGDLFFNTATNFDAIFAANSVPARLGSCDAIGTDTTNVINEQTGRIRAFTTPALTGCLNGIDDGQILNGYLTNYKGGGTDNDRMLIVVSNDDYAYVEMFSCLSGTCF